MLNEGDRLGVVRWVLYGDRVLWLSPKCTALLAGKTVSSVAKPQREADIKAAYDSLAAQTGLAFVDLRELGQRAGLSREILHQELEAMIPAFNGHRQRRIVATLSGTNLAVLTPEHRSWAMTAPGGERAILVRLQGKIL